MSRPVAGRAVLAIVLLALTAVGLLGAYSYWQSYYQHRGFQTVAFLPHAQPGRLETVTFYSPALHRRADYLVYLPPGYGMTSRRYPAYYLLHGSPGRPVVYLDIAGMPVRMDNLISRHRMRPMILVMPDGRIGGSTYSDSEWANTPSGNFASYVIDVMRDVDHRFRTIANRRDRVIAGFSAGAYGATNIFLHNLQDFANLQSWSGYYVEPRTGVFAHAGPATLAANSPLDYIHRVAGLIGRRPVRAFLFVGRDDNDSPQTPPMADALAKAGGTVTYALYHGGHDWQLWHAHLNQLLMLASADTTARLGSGAGIARDLTPGVVPIPFGEGRRHRRRGAAVAPAVTVYPRPASARRPRSARRSRRHAHRHHHGRRRPQGPGRTA
jgi:enterochelin esterase-like enzyme